MVHLKTSFLLKAVQLQQEGKAIITMGAGSRRFGYHLISVDEPLGSRVGKTLTEQLYKPHIFKPVASQNFLIKKRCAS